MSVPLEHLVVNSITSYQLVRGWDSAIPVLYEVLWLGSMGLSWNRGADLQHSRWAVLTYWAGTPS